MPPDPTSLQYFSRGNSVFKIQKARPHQAINNRNTNEFKKGSVSLKNKYTYCEAYVILFLTMLFFMISNLEFALLQTYLFVAEEA